MDTQVACLFGGFLLGGFGLLVYHRSRQKAKTKTPAFSDQDVVALESLLKAVRAHSSQLRIRFVYTRNDTGNYTYAAEVLTLSSNDKWVVQAKTATSESYPSVVEEALKLTIYILCRAMEISSNALRPADLSRAPHGKKA